MAPWCLERTPKSRLGEEFIQLGDKQLRPVEIIAAILREVYNEAISLSGGEAPGEIRLTHPARWQKSRLDKLEQAAKLAGLPDPVFVPEPVAAAVHFASERLQDGEHVAVYDLGGGTLDTAVLKRTGKTFEVVGRTGGDEELGGEDFDDLLYRHLGDQLGGEVWDQAAQRRRAPGPHLGAGQPRAAAPVPARQGGARASPSTSSSSAPRSTRTDRHRRRLRGIDRADPARYRRRARAHDPRRRPADRRHEGDLPRRRRLLADPARRPPDPGADGMALEHLDDPEGRENAMGARRGSTAAPHRSPGPRGAAEARGRADPAAARRRAPASARRRRRDRDLGHRPRRDQARHGRLRRRTAAAWPRRHRRVRRRSGRRSRWRRPKAARRAAGRGNRGKIAAGIAAAVVVLGGVGAAIALSGGGGGGGTDRHRRHPDRQHAFTDSTLTDSTATDSTLTNTTTTTEPTSDTEAPSLAVTPKVRATCVDEKEKFWEDRAIAGLTCTGRNNSTVIVELFPDNKAALQTFKERDGGARQGGPCIKEWNTQSTWTNPGGQRHQGQDRLLRHHRGDRPGRLDGARAPGSRLRDRRGPRSQGADQRLVVRGQLSRPAVAPISQAASRAAASGGREQPPISLGSRSAEAARCSSTPQLGAQLLLVDREQLGDLGGADLEAVDVELTGRGNVSDRGSPRPPTRRCSAGRPTRGRGCSRRSPARGTCRRRTCGTS